MNVSGVLLVAPASPAKFEIYTPARQEPAGGTVDCGQQRKTDPWITLGEARLLALGWGSAFINLGNAGHVNVGAGFGPWPRAKHLVDTLVRCAAPLRFKDEEATPTTCRSSS